VACGAPVALAILIESLLFILRSRDLHQLLSPRALVYFTWIGCLVLREKSRLPCLNPKHAVGWLDPPEWSSSAAGVTLFLPAVITFQPIKVITQLDELIEQNEGAAFSFSSPRRRQ
jgi:hypothetical protein